MAETMRAEERKAAYQAYLAWYAGTTDDPQPNLTEWMWCAGRDWEREQSVERIRELRKALQQAEYKLFRCSVGHGVADHKNYPCALPGEARLIMLEALRSDLPSESPYYRLALAAGAAAGEPDRWPTDEERPVSCPVCGIGWESTDLRRHPTRLLPWWRCSDCSAEWNETIRKATAGDLPPAPPPHPRPDEPEGES